MNKNFYFPIIFVFFFLSGCATPSLTIKSYESARKIRRIAVLPFDDARDHSGSGAILTEDFMSALLQLHYTVIERSQIQKLLSEQKLSLSGAVEPSQAAQIGKILGVEGVILGSVTEYQERFFLIFPPSAVRASIRLVDVQTGEVVWSANHRRYYGILRWAPFPPWFVLNALLSQSAEQRAYQVARDISKALKKAGL